MLRELKENKEYTGLELLLFNGLGIAMGIVTGVATTSVLFLIWG